MPAGVPQPPSLINTLLQRGVWRPKSVRNRFNGFESGRETVETVSEVLPARDTPLKQGVNERKPGPLPPTPTGLRPEGGVGGHNPFGVENRTQTHPGLIVLRNPGLEDTIPLGLQTPRCLRMDPIVQRISERPFLR